MGAARVRILLAGLTRLSPVRQSRSGPPLLPCSLLLAGALAVTVLAAPGEPESDLAPLLKSFSTGVKQYLNSEKELAAQRNKARKKGLAATPQDWRPAPLAEGENAAPVFRELAERLKVKPIPDSKWAILSRLSYRYAFGSSEIEAARKVLAQRQPELELAHRAARRRGCDFGRDWAKGASLRFPELVPMRAASLLVKAEAMLSCIDGRRLDAVATQRLGLRIAQHGAMDPTLVGKLTSQGYESMAREGLATIVYRHAGQTEIVAAVRAALHQSGPPPRWSYTLQGESMMASAMMVWLEEEEWAGVYQLLGEEPDVPLERLAPDDRAGWLKLLQAAEAENLRRVLAIGELAEAPPAQRWQRARKLDAKLGQRSLNPVDLILSIFELNAELMLARDAEGIGSTRTLILGAALLKYRNRHGKFPDKARMALSPVPIDPCTGKPLRYRREDAGFVVYSAGVTGKYDGGTPAKPGNDARRGEAYFRYPAPPPKQSPSSVFAPSSRRRPASLLARAGAPWAFSRALRAQAY